MTSNSPRKQVMELELAEAKLIMKLRSLRNRREDVLMLVTPRPISVRVLEKPELLEQIAPPNLFGSG